jgi:hypothetical protein
MGWAIWKYSDEKVHICTGPNLTRFNTMIFKKREFKFL